MESFGIYLDGFVNGWGINWYDYEFLEVYFVVRVGFIIDDVYYWCWYYVCVKVV